jgi:hypothetical protein
VGSLANQDFPFRVQDQSSKSVNKGYFAEILDVLKNQDPLFENHMNSGTVT